MKQETKKLQEQHEKSPFAGSHPYAKGKKLKPEGAPAPYSYSKKQIMANKMKAFEVAKEKHRAGAPYKTALDAIKSKTFGEMHKARKNLIK